MRNRRERNFFSSTAHSKHSSSMSTRTTTAVQARSSGYSPRQRFLATLVFTALLGTTISVLQTSAATTAFRSRLPAHTLSRLTSSESAFPVPSLPYFADKVSLSFSLLEVLSCPYRRAYLLLVITNSVMD